MTKKLYEVNRERAGFSISATKKGLKLETWSCYWDSADLTFYVSETERFNRNTDFSAKWNDIYTYGEFFMEWVTEWYGTEDQNHHIYRVVRN
jgi:hypothetical protein